MDKKYLVETNEMFAMSEMENVKQSEILHVKCQDIYKIAEQFLGDDHVNFIASHSNGEAEDNLNKMEFCQELVNYSPESSMAIMERLVQVNALRQRHMEIEEEEDKIDAYKEHLDAEEDRIKEALSDFGLVPEEDEEEEPEVYGADYIDLENMG